VTAAAQAQVTASDFASGEVVRSGPKSRTVRFGKTRDEVLNIYRARSTKPAPVLLLLSGIGWDDGPNRYDIGQIINILNDKGIAVVEIITHSDGLEQDIVELQSALRFLNSRTARDRLDLKRMAVLGRGAGASFASLLGTDPKRLPASDLAFEALKGVVVIDGEGYDIERLASEPPKPSRYPYSFGTLREVWRRESATAHLAAPNAPSFFFITYAGSPTRLLEANEFAAALRPSSEVISITTDTPYGDIGARRFGYRGNRTSDDLVEFLVERLK